MMRLSEAILKGCETTKQFYGHYGSQWRNEYCALGTAVVAITGKAYRLASVLLTRSLVVLALITLGSWALTLYLMAGKVVML